MTALEQLKNPRIAVPIIIGVFVLIFVGLLVLILSSRSSTSEQTTIIPPETEAQSQKNLKDLTINPTSPSVLVYGYWGSTKSNIVSINLADGTETPLATLPIDIKKVSVLKNGDLLYINKTNQGDQGTEIVKFSPTTQTQQVIYTASPSFGVDDYVISPDQQYMAIWEVSFLPGSSMLSGGKSQVITKKMGTAQTFIVYSETADQPIHYPRAILNNGAVYFDTYLPNTDAGWAYGMGNSDLTGSSKTEIVSVGNGTYSTQPNPSHDGNNLVFVGYDGNLGIGTEPMFGFRRALLQGNTIDIYDTKTGTRSTLISSQKDTRFTYATYDTNNNIIYSSISKDDSKNGTFVYNVATKKSKKIPPTDNYLAAINPQLSVVGKPNTQQSTIGNLGQTYGPSYTNISILDTNSNSSVPIETRGNMIQYIALTTPAVSALSLQNTQQNLQLETFDLKPQLAPIRQEQQNSKYCMEIAVFQCAEIHSETEFFECAKDPHGETASRIGDRRFSLSAGVQCLLASENKPFTDCVGKNTLTLNQSGSCVISPLYLYGPKNTKVDITIGTPIASYGPTYKNKFSATLADNNIFEIDGKRWESLEYSYISAKKNRTAPEYGTVVARTELATEVQTYAQKLGLNQKETNDLVAKSVSKISKPYVFVSFYDQKTSKEILPISFNPKPDTYINYVFYFKGLDEMPKQLPTKPTFPPIEKRGQFSAVEISEIFE